MLREGLKLTTMGVVLGLAGAAVGARVLSALLFGIQPHDPATFLTVALIFIAVVLVAGGIPARRAMRLDPAITLRRE